MHKRLQNLLCILTALFHDVSAWQLAGEFLYSYFIVITGEKDTITWQGMEHDQRWNTFFFHLFLKHWDRCK